MTDYNKHCETKIPLTLEEVRCIWADLNDKTRLEVLKSIVWTADNPFEFREKAVKVLTSKEFIENID